MEGRRQAKKQGMASTSVTSSGTERSSRALPQYFFGGESLLAWCNRASDQPQFYSSGGVFMDVTKVTLINNRSSACRVQFNYPIAADKGGSVQKLSVEPRPVSA